jgi:hypothetical protein
MKNIIVIITILALVCPIVNADPVKSVDQMMRLELASAQFNQDDEGEQLSYSIGGEEVQSRPGQKSPGRAALYSLMLPGAGQYYVGGASFKAKMFFGLEAGLLFTYLGFRKYGDFKEDAAKGWAVLHAGANPDNGDDNYWVKMTYYDNRDRNEDDGLGYNQMARVYDRNEAALFPETSLYYWNWDNRESRQSYRNLRNQSKTAYERADITVGILIANHMISAIEAFFAASRHNRHLEFSDSGLKLKYRLEPNPGNPAVSLSLVKSFY